MEVNKIICGDNIEIMESMPFESIDLVITSPPYDNLRDYTGYTFDFKRTSQQLYRIIKQGGIIVWVVGDATIDGSETGTPFRQALYFKEIGFNLHDTMIYRKSGMSKPETIRYYQNFEYMFILSKGKPKTVNLLKDKKNTWVGHKTFGTPTSRQKDGTLQKKYIPPVAEYGIRFNIWKYNTGYGYSASGEMAYQHPAIFPEKLAQDHILSWSNEGDLVLDPMCGSGTTCVMAKITNRNYIGIDISSAYCKIAEKRIANTMGRLF